MNEENNNIENTENMKTVIVAQDGSGDYESIGQALFLENSEINLYINVKKGIYKVELLISRIGETHITGEKGCFFTERNEEIVQIIKVVNSNLSIQNIFFTCLSEDILFLFLSNSKVLIRDCFFEATSDIGSIVLLEEVNQVSIINSIFSFSTADTLIAADSPNRILLENNTIIGIEDIIYLESLEADFLIDIKRNLFFEVGDVLRVENEEIDISEILLHFYEKDILSVEKNVNIVESNDFDISYDIAVIDVNILREENVHFIDKQKYDFRLNSNIYKNIGASEKTVLFFLNNEEDNKPSKSKLSKKEILIYIDTLQFKKQFDSFVTHLKESELKNVIPIYSIEELQKQRNISTLVLVSPVDKAENEKEIFNILKEAKKQKKKVFIFLADIKKHTGDKMNIAKMPQVLDTHNKLREEENVSFYENTEQLEKIIYQRLQSNFPNVKLKRLVVKNIGHFSDLKIDFEESNQNAYCFIGTNGTGKTSILRAIILGLIGTSSSALDKNELQNLVKIHGIQNDTIKRENAFVELHYLVDNKKERSRVSCEIAKDGKLEWKDEGSFALLDEPFLESLIIGFSQLRGERGTKQNKENDRQLLPHISDLLPLLHNEVDGRLSDFSHWIIDLYAKANEKEVRMNRQENSTKKETEILERTTINLVFEIVSELLDQKIKFKEVRENKEVWVCTELAENGIPISLVSQGFNTIIGWIGGLLQRMQEVYGLHALGRKKEFQTYPAFCLIDELDPHLHPKVQANLMNVLKKYFPNTLFVFSTHSPLIIPYLEKENVFMLTENGQVSNAHIHTKGRSYQDILLEFMNVPERPEEYIKILDKLYELIENEELEEANKLLNEIKKDFGEDDPEILRARTMIHFIED